MKRPRVALLCLGVAFGCSKGGAQSPEKCQPQMMPGEEPLPTALYAELRHSDGKTTVPVMLDGIGGSYAGATRPFARCDPPGQYTVHRLAVVDVRGQLVATARREGSQYVVRYASGGESRLSASGQTTAVTLSQSGGTAPTATALSLSTASAQQGERVTLSAAAMGDDCGVAQMRFWLTASPAGSMAPGSLVTLAEGQGSVNLRVPVDLTPTRYHVEGQIYGKNGAYTQLRLVDSTATHYTAYASGGGSQLTSIPAVRLVIDEYAEADRAVPQVVSVEAMPQVVSPCQAVRFSMRLQDDRGLPTMQEVRLRLRSLDTGSEVGEALLTGGDVLAGTFTVPEAGPTGVWLGYPATIEDAAGNVGTGSLSGTKFTISGPGATGTPVSAATFVVGGPGVQPPGPDGGVGPRDMAMSPPDLAAAPDLSTPLPVVLSAIDVSPNSVSADQTVTVNVTWIDQTGTLIK